MNGALDKRYARALAAAARGTNRLEEVAGELSAATLCVQNPDLGAALASPVITTAARGKLLAELASSLNLSELTQNFLSLLVENHRINEIVGINRSYRDLVDKELRRVRGELRTARPLADESTDKIRSGLSKAHGLEVLLNTETDASLVGGITVEIEGRVYDGSVRTQLVELARALTRGEGAS